MPCINVHGAALPRGRQATAEKSTHGDSGYCSLIFRKVVSRSNSVFFSPSRSCSVGQLRTVAAVGTRSSGRLVVQRHHQDHLEESNPTIRVVTVRPSVCLGPFSPIPFRRFFLAPPGLSPKPDPSNVCIFSSVSAAVLQPVVVLASYTPCNLTQGGNMVERQI